MYIQSRKWQFVFPFSFFLSNSFLFFSLHFPLDLNCQSNCKRKEPTRSKGPNFGGSSSSTPTHGVIHEGGDGQAKGNAYEVFLSFRGKDTRKGFTDYLYTSLVDAGIHVFRDDNELRVGEEIGSELLCSITQSTISIPIISENYAFSKWCLRELAHILKCKRSGGQIVLPIFYKVEPSQVRHLKGRFGDAINAHKEDLADMTVKEWEEALEEVSGLKGWESEKIDNGHEGALVKIIVTKVLSELKGTFQLIVPQQLVGIDNRVEDIMSLIDAKFNGTWIIGIYGMGGIGKTTLAKSLYNKFFDQFEYHSFVADCRETFQREGIKCLQKQLISSLGSPCNVSNVDEGIRLIKSRFADKKALIFLDDIDDSAHLKYLVDHGWFKVGSIVIITTRNKDVLDQASANHMYHLNELSLDQSFILFNRHAFQKDSSPSDYEDISRDVVSTTGGLPLALEVIGSFLCKKRENVWKDTLKKLKKVPNEKVREKLKISYEALDYDEQQIFLDIACLFIGSRKQNPTYMWDACDFFPEKGIEVLCLMSLIKIDKNGRLLMHDQLRDLGREIVRQENPKEPQEHSRLRIYEEALDVLDNNEGTKKIEALSLGKCSKGKRYAAEQFKELTNLRFLQVDGANFTGDFQSLLPKLRWLQWEECPSDFTANNFHPKKLVVLNLSCSAISEDWGGWDPLKMATELKVINLAGCRILKRTPDLSTFKRLEILCLKYCVNLEELHPSIGDIKTLVSLDVNDCRKLEEPLKGIGRMIELRDLNINATGIHDIPESIDAMKELEVINAKYCEKLAHIPSSIGNLASLQRLKLEGCYSLTEIPDSIGNLASLIELDLARTPITKLPKSIRNLQNLRDLIIYRTGLTELPESIGAMKELKVIHASICKKLAHIPSSIGNLASLQRLTLDGCCSLTEIPDSIGNLASLVELDLHETLITKLPESIGNLQNLRILCIEEIDITELPDAIGMLTKLQRLKASHCKNLERLPSNICKLIALEELLFDRCVKLQELPELPSGLTKLAITSQRQSLPHLSQLTRLKTLTLRDCHRLECVPELPIGLSELYIIYCGKLKALTNLSDLKHLRRFRIAECPSLEGSPDVSNFRRTQMRELGFKESQDMLGALIFER